MPADHQVHHWRPHKAKPDKGRVQNLVTADKGRGISEALTGPPIPPYSSLTGPPPALPYSAVRATVRVRLLLGGNVCLRQVLSPGQCHAFVPLPAEGTGPSYDGLHRILPPH